MDNNADLWTLMGKNAKKIIVYPKMSTIFLNIVRKQCLHACDFFHVWSQRHLSPDFYFVRNVYVSSFRFIVYFLLVNFGAGFLLKVINETKLLGVMVTDDLKWN